MSPSDPKIPDDPNTPGDSDPATNPAGDGVNVSDGSVAQGRTGMRVFIVLAVSLALVVLVLFGVFGLNAGKHAGKSTGEAKPAEAGQAFNTTEPAPKANPPPNAVEAATPGS